MTILAIISLALMLVAGVLYLQRLKQQQVQQATMAQIRARAAQRRAAREHEYRSDRDMLFDSERPLQLGDKEHGIIVRVLDGFDAEVQQ